ncbi:MAG: iron transporter [Halobacteriaceae archaeon]
MRGRRRFLRAAGAGMIGGLAGCSRLFETRSALAPPLVADRPTAAYYPTHVEGMAVVGTDAANGYRCALTYTYPHRFWVVTGTHTRKVTIQPADDVHLMPVVWDADTGIVPPDVNPTIEATRDGRTVAAPAPWPMLSQPMGFHFGENVALEGDGSYTVTVSIGAPSIRRTNGLDGDRGPTTFDFEFAYSAARVEDLPYTDIPADKQGTRGAVDPMSMAALPTTRLPPPSTLPGTVLGTGTSGDATVVLTAIDDATPYGGSAEQTYLGVSLRTPYNDYVIPMASLAVTVTRDGTTVADTAANAAIGPRLRYHYGANIPDLVAGDTVTVRVMAPPQVARHEGYETAFLQFDPVTVTV